MAGFNPSEPRDSEGRWTEGGRTAPHARRAERERSKSPHEIERHRQLQKAIKKAENTYDARVKLHDFYHGKSRALETVSLGAGLYTLAKIIGTI